MSNKVDYMSVPVRMDYYCGSADIDEIDMLIEDYGNKEN